MYERILPHSEARAGAHSREALLVVSGIGSCYARMGEFARAEEHHRRAYEGLIVVAGDEDPDFAGTGAKLAIDWWKLGRLEEAVALARKARDSLPDGSPHVLTLRQLVSRIEAALAERDQ